MDIKIVSLSWLLWIVLLWTEGRNSFGIVICLYICPGVRLLDHRVTLSTVFWGNLILFSIVALPVYISTKIVGGFPFLHTPPTWAICRLFNEGHSDLCKVAHCMCSWWDFPFSYFALMRNTVWILRTKSCSSYREMNPWAKWCKPIKKRFRTELFC